MPFKRTIKYFFIVSALIILLVLILLPHVLPVIVQKLITQRVISETGLKDFHVNIRSIGLFRVDFNEIKLGKTAAIDSAYIDYHISSLLKKKTDGIHISGLVTETLLFRLGLGCRSYNGPDQTALHRVRSYTFIAHPPPLMFY